MDEKNEILQIQETLESYIEGVIHGKYSKIVIAWHMNGNRMFVDSESNTILFENSPAHHEYENYKPRPGVQQSAFIEAIDITGTAASVRLKWTLETPSGTIICTDYLLLLKAQEVWKIVTKVSHKELLKEDT